MKAMENTVYSFRRKPFEFGENQIFCIKKLNLLGAPILHTCAPYKCMQSFSLFFCCLDENMKDLFSRSMWKRNFFTFFLINPA